MTDNKRSEFERKLDRLVHLASKTLNDQIEIPSDETIEAYVFGKATESQKQSILRALEHSSLFRQELLEIMDDLQPMVEKDKSIPNKSELTTKSGSEQLYSTSAPSLWGSIKISIKLRLLVPAAAIAAVALLLLWQSETQVSSWDLVAEVVDPGRLLSFDLKGASDQETANLYSSAKEAAFGAFRQIITLGPDGITVDTQYVNSISSSQNMLTHVVLLDGAKNFLAQYQISLDSAYLHSDSSVQAWMLLLPSRNLMKINMTSDSVQTILPRDSDTQGCLTITILSDSGWSFTPPSSFGF